MSTEKEDALKLAAFIGSRGFTQGDLSILSAVFMLRYFKGNMDKSLEFIAEYKPTEGETK